MSLRIINLRLDGETLEKLDKIVYVLRRIGYRDITRSDIIRQGIMMVINDYYSKIDIELLYKEMVRYGAQG